MRKTSPKALQGRTRLISINVRRMKQVPVQKIVEFKVECDPRGDRALSQRPARLGRGVEGGAEQIAKSSMSDEQVRTVQV